MNPFLRLQDVQHRYNGRTVLDIPELRITRGSITGLAGPNGSGKSTLLKILALAEKCTTGTVLVAGEPALPFAANARHNITLLPQETYLLRRTVFDNVAYGLRIKGQTRDLPASVAAGLGLVGLDSSFAGRKWHELSGGEAQRVALAARLVLRPGGLLLDEPTASVDLKSALLIRQAVLHAREKWGTTLIIASHHRSWLHDICDQLLYLYNGRLLDCSLDNLLPGPWKTTDADGCYTRIGDGQFIFASRPPAPDSSGVLPPASLRLADRAPKEGERAVRGTVTGMYIDKHLPDTCIHVNCSGILLLATAPPKDFEPGTCRPGQEVTLLYRPDTIVWLS